MSENQPKYNIGDQVQLKSGGPCMTIKDLIRDHHSEEFDGNYRCQWFAGKKLDSGVFSEDSLMPYVAPKVNSEVKKSSSR